MFHNKTGTPDLEHKEANRTPSTIHEPLIMLDVDETLILGQNEKGELGDIYNQKLIDALVKAGIREVYLFTSFKLHLLTTPEKRSEVQQLMRLQLIHHLAENGITVKALISNYDLIPSSENKDASFLDNIPGSYYSTVIQPQEQRVLDNPAIDLTDSKDDYGKLVEAQTNNAGVLNEIVKQYAPHDNPKSPMADLFFTWLKKTGMLSADNSRPVLFFDDRPYYLEAVSTIAEKHKIHIECFRVTQKSNTENYLGFLSGHYPDHIEYPTVIAGSYDLIQKSKKEAESKLTSFLGDNKHKNAILTPVNDLLKVIQRVQKDIQKNPDRHDCMGACKAITHEMTKRIQLLKQLQDTLPEKEKKIVEALLLDLNSAFDMTGKIYTTLAAHFKVDFRVDARVDIKAREAQENASQVDPLEGEIKTATQLPSPLVSIVRSYFPLPPTPRDVARVNEDLRRLNHLSECDWNGIAVTMERYSDIEYRWRADLCGLRLNGIIFKGQQESHLAEIETKSEVYASAELENWYDWYRDHSPGRPNNIDFSRASLTGAKFENLLCASICFNNTTLTDASFKLSILTGASFRWANMSNADLSLCYGATYTHGDKFSPHFDQTDLTHANLYKSNFTGTRFYRTTLDVANLSEGTFNHASFSGCSMKHAILAMAHFSNAKFCPDVKKPVDHDLQTNLSGANATGATFTNADFTGVNLQDAIFSEAKLMGAVFTGADMTGALLNEAHFTFDQFTREQVLSFHYIDKNARGYVNAIYDYMEENEESKHQKGFQRARLLLISFIDGHPYVKGENKLLAGFLATGNLPGEGSFSSFYSSSERGENSLRGHLLKAHKKINEPNATVTYHTTRKLSE